MSEEMIELPVAIPRDEVLRGLGYPPGRQPPARTRSEREPTRWAKFSRWAKAIWATEGVA